MADVHARTTSRRVHRWRQQVAKLVQGAVPGYQDPQALPLDLNAVAKGLGVGDIRYLARDVHGFTDWSTKRPTVYLATSRSDGRRRFTLGHECGHLMLGDDGANAAHNPLVTSDLIEDIELTCDAVAAELLLPFAWLDEFGEYIRDLEAASFAADHLRVSLATLVVRMGHWGARPSLFRLQATLSGDWVIVHRVGAPAALRGRISLDEATATTFTMLSGGNHDLHITFCDAAGLTSRMAANIRKVDSEVTVYIPDTEADA